LIAYTFQGKQLKYAINSYNSCCITSRNVGHYFDHAETKLIQQLSYVPKTMYIFGITQGKKEILTTIPCNKCMKLLKTKGIKRIVCNYFGNTTIIKL
jgi:deoxycytidylate deaminase